jgi:hypothetical protein
MSKMGMRRAGMLFWREGDEDFVEPDLADSAM